MLQRGDLLFYKGFDYINSMIARLFVSISFLFISAELVAQVGNTPVQKEYLHTLYQVSPRVDLVFEKNKVNFYLESLINGNATYSSITEQTRWNIKPGVDIGLTEKWFVGVSERVNMNGAGVYNYTTRFYVQHRGKIGGLLFLKECIYEQFNYVDGTLNSTTSNGTSSTRRPAVGRVGFGFGIGKYVPIKKNNLAIFLSYRPFMQFDFVQDGIAYFKDRFIDYTNLRIDIGYVVNNTYYIGLYASRDTNFSYVPAANPYDSNSITPIYGIACNVLFYTGQNQEKVLSSFRYFYTK